MAKKNMIKKTLALVLVVAAAVCLRIFAYAGIKAKQSAAADLAMQQAQCCAEVLKNTAGDMEEAARLLGGTATETGLQYSSEKLTVYAQKKQSPQPLLGQACVTVCDSSGQLCVLELCWQKVGE